MQRWVSAGVDKPQDSGYCESGVFGMCEEVFDWLCTTEGANLCDRISDDGGATEQYWIYRNISAPYHNQSWDR